MQISTKLLGGLHGVAILVKNDKSKKIFCSGPHTRVPPLARFRGYVCQVQKNPKSKFLLKPYHVTPLLKGIIMEITILKV